MTDVTKVDLTADAAASEATAPLASEATVSLAGVTADAADTGVDAGVAGVDARPNNNKRKRHNHHHIARRVRRAVKIIDAKCSRIADINDTAYLFDTTADDALSVSTNVIAKPVNHDTIRNILSSIEIDSHYHSIRNLCNIFHDNDDFCNQFFNPLYPFDGFTVNVRPRLSFDGNKIALNFDIVEVPVSYINSLIVEFECFFSDIEDDHIDKVVVELSIDDTPHDDAYIVMFNPMFKPFFGQICDQLKEVLKTADYTAGCSLDFSVDPGKRLTATLSTLD